MRVDISVKTHLFVTFTLKIKSIMKEKKGRAPITIYHVHFFDNQANKGLEKDFYFGSISAICETFDKSRIGIVASSLYNFNLDEVKNPVYENKLCRIKKSILITKSKSK